MRTPIAIWQKIVYLFCIHSPEIVGNIHSPCGFRSFSLSLLLSLLLLSLPFSYLSQSLHHLDPFLPNTLFLSLAVSFVSCHDLTVVFQPALLPPMSAIHLGLPLISENKSNFSPSVLPASIRFINTCHDIPSDALFQQTTSHPLPFHTCSGLVLSPLTLQQYLLHPCLSHPPPPPHPLLSRSRYAISHLSSHSKINIHHMQMGNVPAFLAPRSSLLVHLPSTTRYAFSLPLSKRKTSLKKRTHGKCLSLSSSILFPSHARYFSCLSATSFSPLPNTSDLPNQPLSIPSHPLAVILAVRITHCPLSKQACLLSATAKCFSLFNTHEENIPPFIPQTYTLSLFSSSPS